MKQPKIVFFDIDDTLYIKDEARIPSSIIEQVLPRLREKEIIPAIATGRAIGIFPDALKPLLGSAGFEFLVSINGQYNCYQDQIISHYPLAISRIEQAIEKLKSIGVVYGLVSHDMVAVSEDNEMVRGALAPIKNDYVIDPDLHHHRAVYQMLAFFPESQVEKVVASGVLGEDLKIVRWHENAVDLLNSENSKARGISDVLAYLGIAKEESMAFGDGFNDLEMLSFVGMGIAMGNAEPALKAVADYVTLPIKQDGVLYALENLGVI